MQEILGADDTFRKSMLERLDGSLESVRRDSVSGDEVEGRCPPRPPYERKRSAG